MGRIWDRYAEINDELIDVKEIIRKNIRSREKYLEASISPMVQGGGKMLRPAFLLLAAKFGEYDEKKIHNLAAVVEMLHMATLVHDDIIDDAQLRRNVETIQYQYGKDYAVYVGDFLFCQCLLMLSKYEYNSQNMTEMAKAISKICMGEIGQFHLRNTRDMNIRKYVRIVSGKTAALFALSFYVGAKESKCNVKTTKILGRIGYNVGMAFQIIDDLLDYCGDEQNLGKNGKLDIKKGYYTLPLIYALEKDKDHQLGNLLNQTALHDRDVEEIIRLVKQFDGIQRTKNVADRYTRKAMADMEKLPDCKYKTMLQQIILELLKRDH